MTMVSSSYADEQMIAAARKMMEGNRARSERVCYYRTPQLTPDGSKHAQAGWIMTGDTQQSIKTANIARGYMPLEQYGYVGATDPEVPEDTTPLRNFSRYGKWGQLLSTQEGLREFPKDQILAYHWYNADRLRRSLNGNLPPTLKVKNGMVLWPQLAGQELKIFACPECTDWPTLQAIFLGRHLRVWHDYSQADLIDFGKQYGIDFAAELAREGQVKRTLTFDAAAEDDTEVEEPELGFSLTVDRPERRGPGRPRKEN